MPWREKKGALELDHLPHNIDQGEREPASSSEPSYHTENFGLQEYKYFLISSIYVQLKLLTNNQLHCLSGSASSPPRKLRGRSWLLEVRSLRHQLFMGISDHILPSPKGKRWIRELFYYHPPTPQCITCWPSPQSPTSLAWCQGSASPPPSGLCLPSSSWGGKDSKLLHSSHNTSSFLS